MQLPYLQHPERYSGLYVVDFGDFVNVGYTADEVAVLLALERYHNVKVFRIYRGYADGRLELVGASMRRFGLESGMIFYRRRMEDARKDFAELGRLSRDEPLPCRARLVLLDLDQGRQMPYATLLAYPAEQEDEVSQWLIAHAVTAGDAADGGPAAVAAALGGGEVIEATQVEAQPSRRSRSRSKEEVLTTLDQAVQRIL